MKVLVHPPALSTAGACRAGLQCDKRRQRVQLPGHRGSGFDFPLGIAFQDGYLYAANFQSNTVSVCAVNSNGTLSGCTSTGTGFSGPMSVTLNSAGTLAYITNNNGSGPTVCSVDVDGSLSACAPGFSGIPGTAGIAFLTGGQQTYMTASTTANLYLCTVNQDGTLSGCTPQTDPAISRGMAIH
jgi:DNA-binding beta-propeller fold protein YncE